jgi:hypothetical protein
MGVPYVSREELFQSPVITNVISQIDVPGSLFQRTYGPSGQQDRVQGRTASWDLFHNTRSIPSVRAPRTGPSMRNRKPYGQRSAQLIRMHEKMFVADEDLMRYRPAGGPIGAVDTAGQAYIKQQLQYFAQIFRNGREFMWSRLFRGGFGVKVVGDEMQLVEKGAGGVLFDVDYGVPAAHTGNLGGIVNASWSNAATDVISQFMELEKYAARVNGRPPRHIWINGTTAKWLFENTQLSTVRGTANRIFDSLSRREIDPMSTYPDTGYDIVFGAMPMYIFHVYNAVLANSGAAEDFDTQISSGSTSLLIPDNVAIITPDPGTWCGTIQGSEYVRENVTSEMREVSGFGAWSTPVIDPPGREVKQVDNFLPVLYEPYAIYYATVIF